MSEKIVIDSAAISAKEMNCSRFARFHHVRQRARLVSSSGNA